MIPALIDKSQERERLATAMAIAQATSPWPGASASGSHHPLARARVSYFTGTSRITLSGPLSTT